MSKYGWVEDDRLQTKTFNGKPIVNINSEHLIDASKVALLLSEPEKRLGWTGYRFDSRPKYLPGEEPLEETTIEDLIVPDPDPVSFEDSDNTYRYQYSSKVAPAVVKAVHGLLNFKELDKVDTVAIGQWGGRGTDSRDAQDLLELLVEHEASLPNLKAFFIGAVTTLDLDINDIPLPYMGVFLNYFTQLDSFKARGKPDQPEKRVARHKSHRADTSTFFEVPLYHLNLKELVIETAVMDKQTIENLSKSHLPKLERLELWFGDLSYCYFEEAENMLEAVRLLLKNSFPSLRYLGLRNASQTNDFAIMLADSPLLGQLEELDLSLGIFSDSGAQALLKSSYLSNLKKLTFYHHQIKDLGLLRQFEAKLPAVDFNNGVDERCYESSDGYSDIGVFIYE